MLFWLRSTAHLSEGVVIVKLQVNYKIVQSNNKYNNLDIPSPFHFFNAKLILFLEEEVLPDEDSAGKAS